MEKQTAIIRENFLDSVIFDSFVLDESGRHYFEAARTAPDANLRLLS